MAIYLIVFTFSIVLMRIAYKNDGISSRNVRLALFFSAFILILLASLRGDHVGKDILVYQKDLYIHALRIKSLPRFLKWSYEEPGYSLVTYIGARMGHFAFVHALNMTLIIVPMFYLIWEARVEMEPDITLAVFLFLYYVQGYNVVRQQIAITFIALGLNQFMKKKYLNSLLFLCIAISFHYTAIIGICIYAVYWMVESRLKTLYQFIVCTLVIFGTVNFVSLGKTTGIYLVKIFRISKSSYSSSLAWSSKASNFNETYLLFGTIGLIILLLCKYCTRLQKTWINRSFLLYMMFILLISTILTKNMGYASRVFCFFEIWVIFVIPQILKIVSNDWKSRAIAKTLILGLLVAVWVFGVVVKGWHAVIPYYTFWQT
ncbi:EpsG family protein [Butyrivibrio sp. VCB2001]|uniref:EpsG family protein n=1 Tax=Butyrivibrio sp. VCB2001 TaxID=1280667 RepID=UPI000409A79F|nr:EpsG family protein [Butyrivibrio sp. VCB2001]